MEHAHPTFGAGRFAGRFSGHPAGHSAGLEILIFSIKMRGIQRAGLRGIQRDIQRGILRGYWRSLCWDRIIIKITKNLHD